MRIGKIFMVIHLAAAVIFTAAAVGMKFEGELLTGSVLVVDINLAASVMVFCGFRFAAENGLQNPEMLSRLFNAISAEMLLFSLPMLLSAAGLLTEMFFIMYSNIIAAVLFITVIFIYKKYG